MWRKKSKDDKQMLAAVARWFRARDSVQSNRLVVWVYAHPTAGRPHDGYYPPV